MNRASKTLVLLIITFTISVKLNAQCESKPKYIGWLSKVFGIEFPINEPSNITYATKVTSIYMIPYAFNAISSFVIAGNEPYFYLWTGKNHVEGPTDFLKGDKIVFYLSDGSKIESSCYSDYPGIAGQTVSFYQLQKENLMALSTVPVDSITLQGHLRRTDEAKAVKSEDNLIVLRKFSRKNIDLIKDWAKCLLDNLSVAKN